LEYYRNVTQETSLSVDVSYGGGELLPTYTWVDSRFRTVCVPYVFSQQIICL